MVATKPIPFSVSAVLPLEFFYSHKSRRHKMIRISDADKFWKSSDGQLYFDKKGCYILALRSSKGAIIPCYVGKTEKCFGNEALHSDKLIKFNEVLFDCNGTPQIIFISQDTKRINKSAIDEIETWLIDTIGRRDKFINKKKINSVSVNINSFNLKWRIRGVVKPATGEKNASNAKMLLKLLRIK